MKGDNVEKVLKCDLVFPGCPTEVHGESEEEVMRGAAEHARTAHGLEQVDEQTANKVRSAIRSR